MPAHIGVSGLVRWTTAFLDQKTGFTDSGAMFKSMGKTALGRQLGATDHGVSPAATARLAEANRSKRERMCNSFAEYRAALEEMNPQHGKSGYRMVSRDSRTMSTTESFDKKGFAAFEDEWKICLRPGAAFDLVVAQLFDDGWTVMLIMKKSDKRLKQLKRIEGIKPRSSTPRVLWSMD